MAILDPVTPKYYKVQRLGIQREGTDVTAAYDIVIFNVNGNPMTTLNMTSVLTQQERQAIAAIFQRDKGQFEAATDLTEWVPPES